MHAALGDPARLQIVDLLILGDASPVRARRAAGDAVEPAGSPPQGPRDRGRHRTARSEGDRRRTYLRLATTLPSTRRRPRHRYAAASGLRVHRELGPLPPGRGPVATSQRHPVGLGRNPPRRTHRPRRLSTPPTATSSHCPGAAHGTSTTCSPTATSSSPSATTLTKSLADAPGLHWSVPDPVPVGTDAAFDRAYERARQPGHRPRQPAPVRLLTAEHHQ